MATSTSKVSLLDHGYLQLVEGWGSDESIIEAARMSTGKGFLGWEGGECSSCKGSGRVDDRGDADTGQPAFEFVDCIACAGTGKVRGDKHLLAYLYRHNHSTPFEMAGLIVEVQAPIAVFREWHRHRTQSYNEMSGRYIAIPNLNYVPSVERLMINAGSSNKQAGTIKNSVTLTEDEAKFFRKDLAREYESQEATYQHALGRGVPKELARMHLGVGRYSRMRASANLRNWLAFLTLRQHLKAQWEIRQYAKALADLIEERFPRTYALYVADVAAREGQE